MYLIVGAELGCRAVGVRYTVQHVCTCMSLRAWNNSAAAKGREAGACGYV